MSRKRRPDVARGRRRRCAHALPEALILAVRVGDLARPVRSDEGGDEIEWQDRSAAHEHGREEADPNQVDVEPGVIGDAGANAQELAVALVAVEARAAGRLITVDRRDAAVVGVRSSMSLFLGQQPLACAAVRDAMLAPGGVLRVHDPLDRADPVVKPPRHFVQVVEQSLVAGRERLRLLPLGDVVEDQPRQADEQDRDDRSAE